MNNPLLFSILFVGIVITLSIIFNFWFYLILGGVVALVLMFIAFYFYDEYGGGSAPVEWGETSESRRQIDDSISRLRERVSMEKALREKVRREWDEFDISGDDMR